MGKALLESKRLFQDECIVSVINKEDLEYYGATSEDLEGIVSQLRSTAGVEVSVFLYETDTEEYKVSMRSNGKVDVSKIAALFGGGGHVRAAGCSLKGKAHDVLNNITTHIEQQLC